MGDILTLLEDKLDEAFRDRTAKISDARFVVSWDDYNFRAGYLDAIRDIGEMIKKIRSPETAVEETGEIPSILVRTEENVNG